MVTNLEDLRILIPDLGTLHIKGDIVLQKELDKLVPILNAYNKNPPKTPIKYQRHQALIEKVNKLTKLRDEHLQNTENKKTNKQLRYEIRANREAQESMEKPGPDTGGSIELNLDNQGGGGDSPREGSDLPQ